jgi:cystathionine beta-synthase
MMHGARANILAAVGATPLVRLNRVIPADLAAEVYVKCEHMNPSGSHKDRAAERLVRRAEEEGHLRPGGTLVEVTSGSMGASLAMVAAVKGYRAVFVVPDHVSHEKVASLRAWGARVIVCPAAVEASDTRSVFSVARRVADETVGAVFVEQHANEAGPEAYGETLGDELWTQTQGELDVVVAALGTGAALTGVSRTLKAKKPGVQIVGVDPVGSVYFDAIKHGLVTRSFGHKVEGMGGTFMPQALDVRALDDCVRVDDRECFTTARDLVRLEGLWCGGASGAAVAGAIKWARARQRSERVVVLLADNASRYLSTVFNDDWMREGGFLDADASLGTVRELVAQRAQSLITARSDDTLRAVVGKMKAHGVSQLPVVDGMQLRGIVSEVEVLRNLVSGEAHLDATIERILDSDYATVTPDTRIDLLKAVLSEAKVALVTDGPRLLGIVSKIDVIDYLSRRVTDGVQP